MNQLNLSCQQTTPSTTELNKCGNQIVGHEKGNGLTAQAASENQLETPSETPLDLSANFSAEQEGDDGQPIDYSFKTRRKGGLINVNVILLLLRYCGVLLCFDKCN